MNKNKGMLIVVSGFSGAGKNTVVNELLEKYPDEFVRSISVTTREPRENEKDGIDYFFRTKKQFDSLLASNELLEWDTYADNFYGTPKFFIEEQLEQGKKVLMILNTFGARYVKNKYPNTVLIFVTPDSINTIFDRLRNRKSENDVLIKKRKNEMQEEVNDIEYYDYLVLNNDLDKCVNDVYKIVNAHKMSVKNNRELISEFKEKLGVNNKLKN